MTTEQLDAFERELERWLYRTSDFDFGIDHSECKEIASFARTLASRLSPADNPELDATDGAHPAWWRGHDHTTAVFCRKVNEILDGKDDGAGVANEPWESTRRKLLARLSPEKPLPDEEGWWWEWRENAKTWAIVQIDLDDEEDLGYYDREEMWLSPAPGRWVRALPPGVPGKEGAQ